MRTVYKREMKEYFTTPVAYVYLTAVSGVSAIYFFIMLLNGEASFESEFLLLFTVTLLLSPLLAMRLICDERKQCTMQLLMSAPINISSIVTGKFMAASTIYVIGLVPVLLQALSLGRTVSINWSIILFNLLGLALVGMSCIAVCMLFSALSDNQIVSAIGGFAAMIAILLLNTLAGSIKIGFIKELLLKFSFYNSYFGISVGILRLQDIWFF